MNSSLALVSPAVATEKGCVFRTSNKSTYSSNLGVVTVPAYVVVNNVRHPGLYVSTRASSELGRSMGLSPGVILLTLDGYTMSTPEMADHWLEQRPQKPLVFTYATVRGGRPVIGSSQVQFTRKAASSSSSTSSSSGSKAADVSIAELEQYVFGLINDSRRSEGLSPLRIDSSLARLARNYADYMSQHPEGYEITVSRSPHVDLQGRSPQDRAREAGLSANVMENIGRGSRGPFSSDMGMLRNVHDQMMAEPKGQPNHRSAIMNPEAHNVGIGLARTANRFYLTEEFSN